MTARQELAEMESLRAACGWKEYDEHRGRQYRRIALELAKQLEAFDEVRQETKNEKRSHKV